LAEFIPTSVRALKTDAIATERIEKVKNEKKIGEVGS
jgi:hypothetical protein